MLNHLATVVALRQDERCSRRRPLADDRLDGENTLQHLGVDFPVFDPTPAYNLVNVYLGYQPIPNVVAAVSVENLLNVDYTKYMCCSTAACYVVPSPGITFKGSLTIRYGVKGDS
jgi:outer membrane receptor protein involved in Fe transport